MEETGFESRLKELEVLNDDDWEIPESNFDIDYFWGEIMEKGDDLLGVFLERRDFKDKEGDPFTVLLIQANKPKPGIYSVIENKFLKNKLGDITPGDGLLLKYNGKTRVKNGKGKYHTYNVKIIRYSEPSNNQDQPKDSIQELDLSRFNNPEINAIAQIIKTSEPSVPVTAANIVKRAEEIHLEGRLTEEDFMKIKKDLGVE